jgi:hypothetical protein
MFSGSTLTTFVSLMALFAVAPRALAQPVGEPAPAPTPPTTEPPPAETQPQPPPPAAEPAPPPPEPASAAEPPPPEPPPPYEPPVPPPPQDDGGTTQLPDMSVRIDPFNWLLEGRLGVELEVAAWKFISFELVPVFVVNSQPPALNLSGGFPDVLKQESNGLGALAAASLGVGFWITGKPFDGTVLKAIYEHSGYTYKAEDDSVFDEVTHTGRRFYGFLGWQDRFPREGIFTIAAGIGLGWEFNQQRRCFSGGQPSGDCQSEDLLLALDRNQNGVVDLNGPLHPAYIMGRLSLGVVF